ncbi:MbnP family protein [Sphingobacterium paramultivorum]|uniref:MbnP family protein n=1 Tax=Sphingobacterium paramultivorum TaxID=2886510 RepID=UPI00129CB82C|nr:MbnP family protein [Sphingobacterium paramultivorum]
MKNNAIKLLMISLVMVSCSKSEDVANSVNLHFNNTFKNTTIVLGSADSPAATTNTSASGQLHQFSELKYVISNIRLIKADGSEIPYNVNDLDKGATVIDQAKAATLNYVLSNIPVGEYKQIKFGLGVKQKINTLDQLRFPVFYATAGANDTKMHWEWGTGYRFTKLEGFYGADHKELSIHTGSTINGTNGDESTYKQGVDAYRDITLNLPSLVTVGKSVPQINIRADFDKLLSGKTNTITLGANNAVPSIHSAVEMVKFVDNLGGNGSSDTAGMFTVESVSN